jgi:hypothetical protein
MKFTPQDKLEYFIIKAFYHRFNENGVCCLQGSLFETAYDRYVHDFYAALGCEITNMSIENGNIHIEYYKHRTESFEKDTAPLWEPEECLYYTLIDMGMNSVAEQYVKHFVDRGLIHSWDYKWDINWLARY